MGKYIWPLIVLLIMNSCYQVNEKQAKIPDVLLTEQQLAEVITEMQITEAGFAISEKMKLERNKKPFYYKAIMEKYDVTLDDIRDNIIYYQSQPKVMEHIYETVLKNLSKIQSEVKEEERIQKTIEDSLKKVQDSLSKTISIELDTAEVKKGEDVLKKVKSNY